ncbi:MAG: hypothetical protein KZQ60_10985 [Candidatus Thiodiazotropha sp. (ex Lucinoma aequizonata)]|nr:hypothetical protein [Candidatus Thiodiazotropha sp. (ex Lucinoma aequizonata)]MCU7911156.1 hypothetical protein [Candidatus Thiodiazotropha sp. (ex Lucinoma aequizonata)]
MPSLYALHLSLSVAIPAIQPRLRLSRTNRLRSAFHGGQRKKLGFKSLRESTLKTARAWATKELTMALYQQNVGSKRLGSVVIMSRA